MRHTKEEKVPFLVDFAGGLSLPWSGHSSMHILLVNHLHMAGCVSLLLSSCFNFLVLFV